jgi:hypothetical protein
MNLMQAQRRFVLAEWELICRIKRNAPWAELKEAVMKLIEAAVGVSKFQTKIQAHLRMRKIK